MRGGNVEFCIPGVIHVQILQTCHDRVNWLGVMGRHSKKLDFPSCETKSLLKWNMVESAHLCTFELFDPEGHQAMFTGWPGFSDTLGRNRTWMSPRNSWGAKVLWIWDLPWDIFSDAPNGHNDLFSVISLFQTYFIVCATEEAQRLVIFNMSYIWFLHSWETSVKGS